MNANRHDVPTFRVFALGLRGSGKTVFLASMLHFLSVPRANRGFFLKCLDEKSSADLFDKFNEVESSPEWPEGNQSLSEYDFECRYQPSNRAGDELLCRFNYLDYPGGWILGQGSPTISIQETARNSDSILVLLDGKKIRDFLESTRSKIKKDEPNFRTILDDVRVLVPILVQCVTARKPIHFMVTKADILDPKRHSLIKIQNALFTVEPFLQILKLQASNIAIHMAPISSVGDEFATYDKQTGQMLKKPNATIRPFNVDLSIALTMYDHLKAIVDNIEPNLLNEIKSKKRTISLYGALEKALTVVVSSPVSLFMATVTGDAISTDIIEIFLGGFHQMIIRRRQYLENKIKEIQKNMTSQQTAFAAVLSIQALLIKQFETKLPESNLCKRLR